MPNVMGQNLLTPKVEQSALGKYQLELSTCVRSGRTPRIRKN